MANHRIILTSILTSILTGILTSTAGAYDQKGGKGDDTLTGGARNDWLYGREGHDRLYGREGHDRLYGGAGNDQLYGGAGNDKLYGEAGDDKLDGSRGIDRLEGGEGNDLLHGGTGSNIFGFAPGDSLDIGDVITNFTVTGTVRDVLRLKDFGFDLVRNANGSVATTLTELESQGLKISDLMDADEDGVEDDRKIILPKGRNTITLLDVGSAALTIDNFEFSY